MSTTVEAESGTGTAPIVVQQQSGAIGALITGVNLAAGADEATFELLHGALLDHGVICIRGQGAMTPDDQLAKVYVDDQVAAHTQAIALFDKESKDGKDVDLRGFASDNVGMLRTHCEHAKAVQ